ncbi:MAG: methylmalonyl-CoA mutase family protein [Solirubrobacterales bacterium]
MSESLAGGFPSVSSDEWREQATKDTPGAEPVTELEDGITAKWLYTRDDQIAPDPAGLPGKAPFVRGTRSGRHWQIRQEQTNPDRTVANREILEDLNGGVTELTLRLDLAGRLGSAPGSEAFADQRGEDGIAISNLDDLSQVLDGVYLDLAPVALEAGSAFLPAAALLAAHWRETGISPDQALASFRADPLGALASEGSLPFSPEEGLEQAAHLAAQASREYPKVRALGVDSTVYVEAGATAAWELGIALSTAVEHLRAGDEAGLNPSQVARQIEFTLGVGPDQFLEMAKFRAVRRIWARVLEECGVAEGERHSATYARTSGRMITWIDPWVNMLRVTTATFAAGTGGADGVTATPFDRALGEPGQIGRRIARNTQIVLQDESSLGRIADPLAGSWYGEVLSDEVARAGWQRFREIEAEGGALAALRSGLIADSLAEAADRREDELIHRARVMTGVNEFPILDGEETDSEPVDREALARLDAARLAERPELKGLDQLAVASPEERFATAVSLAVSGARIDEMVAALSAGAADRPGASGAADGTAGPGEANSIRQIEQRPDAAPFEHLRSAVDAFEQSGGAQPRMYLACMGTVAAHVNFANWAKSFFEVAGIETVPSGALDGNKAQAEVFAEGGFEAVAVCAGRKEDPAEVADLVARLRESGATYVYMVNSTPGINEASGADEVVSNGVDMEAVLTAALERLGVPVESRVRSAADVGGQSR